MTEFPPDPSADTQTHIPEFKRATGNGVPWLGLIVIAILVITGIGLLTFAVVYSQGESENRAINGTVAAVIAFTHTPTQTRPPTNTPLPSNTPTTTAPPTNTQPPAATPTSPAPTAAATATQRPPQVVIPTDTPPPPTNTPVPISAHGITGGLALCDSSKTSYAAKAETSLGLIERVCIIETLQNHNGQPVTYGILGVLAQNTSGGANQFQTSWRGDLSINGGCTGPSGNGGCGGSHTDTGFFIDQPGSYVLTLRICYSGVDTCLANSGDWETLSSGIPIQIISWTPSP